MSNSPYMKGSEISSFCRGRIARATQDTPPPHCISPLSFYKVIRAVNASSYFRPPQGKRKKKMKSLNLLVLLVGATEI